jgi:hypothetical protein
MGSENTDNQPGNDSEKKTGHSSGNKETLRYFLEIAFCVVFLLFDALEFWPTNRFLALLPATAILILLFWIECRKPIASALSSLVLAAAVLLYFFAPAELPTETSEHGWLLPANEPTPPTGCPRRDLPDDPGILFVAGHSGILTDNPGKSRVLTIDDVAILSVERDGNKLMLDADIYSPSTGNLVARILRNEFHLVASEYSYHSDRDKDRSKLAIYDRKGDEVFFVEYVNPRAVRVRGVFASPGGMVVRVTDEKIVATIPNGPLVTFSNTCRRGFPPGRAGYAFKTGNFTF